MKKIQDTEANSEGIFPSQEDAPKDKHLRRRIFYALLLILFAWALVNLIAVVQFIGRVLSILSPFLLGAAIAFLINTVLRPLERVWSRKLPIRFARPFCGEIQHCSSRIRH